MSKLRYGTSMSLDGFTAGADQSFENPLGVGGRRLHEWMYALASWRSDAGLSGGENNESTAPYEKGHENVGAMIMGRNMFGGSGPWGDPPWNGWWGDDPPFHVPVFVLTHYPREPLELSGRTTFTFVTQGIASALERARAAAGDRDVVLAGGATVAKHCFAAGLIDEFTVSLVPLFLGRGVRLFDDPVLSGVRLEKIRAVDAPGVTHLKYRVLH